MSIRGIGRGEGGIWHGELGGTRKFAEKKHYGRDVQIQHIKAAVLDLNTVPDDRHRSLCVEDIGKLHFPPRYSGNIVEGEKPNKKMFAVKPSGTLQPKNIKRIPQPGPKPDRPEGKRDYPADRMRRGVEIQDPTALDVGWQHMRVVKQGMDGTGPPVKQRVSSEYNMEQAMNRKQRFKGSGIDPTNESDVAYSLARTRDVRHHPRGRYRENNQNPEYSKGYYLTGGLVPGSSITLRASGKPTLRKSDEVGGGDGNGKTMRTYKEIARERELQYDLDQVRFLTQATSKLGRAVPSWEVKTGFYLVKPEDEKD